MADGGDLQRLWGQVPRVAVGTFSITCVLNACHSEITVNSHGVCRRTIGCWSAHPELAKRGIHRGLLAS